MSAAFLLATALVTGTPIAAPSCDFERAMQAFAGRQWESAHTQFEACDTGPQAPMARFYQALAQRHLGNTQTALRLLREVNRLTPEFANACLEIGATLEAIAQQAEAHAQYRRCANDYPDDLAAQLNLARLEHWRGDVERALAGYQTLLATHPKHLGVRVGYGFALIAARRLVEARKQFAAALELAPDDASAQQGLTMAERLRNVEMTVSVGRTNDHQRGKADSIYVRAKKTISHRVSWDIEGSYSNLNLASPEALTIQPYSRVNQAGLAAAMEWRPRRDTKLRLGYGVESSDTDRQSKWQFELSQRVNGKEVWFLGTAPKVAAGKLQSSLSYLGYSRSVGERSVLTSKLYHATERDFTASQALTLDWEHGIGDDDWWQLGLSLGRANDRLNHAVSIRTTQNLKGGFALVAGASYGSSNRTTQFHTAIRYDF